MNQYDARGTQYWSRGAREQVCTSWKMEIDWQWYTGNCENSRQQDSEILQSCPTLLHKMGHMCCHNQSLSYYVGALHHIFNGMHHCIHRHAGTTIGFGFCKLSGWSFGKLLWSLYDASTIHVSGGSDPYCHTPRYHRQCTTGATGCQEPCDLWCDPSDWWGIDATCKYGNQTHVEVLIWSIFRQTLEALLL